MESPYLNTETIIRLLAEQYPDKLEVLSQLKSIGPKKWFKKAYIVITEGYVKKNPVKESIVLQDEEVGTLVIDVLTDGKIKGIEILGRIEQ